jgi:hypothetical protein
VKCSPAHSGTCPGSQRVSQFVVKGGILLAAVDARRLTADLDALARSAASDQAAILTRVTEIARHQLDDDDGVEYLTQTAEAAHGLQDRPWDPLQAVSSVMHPVRRTLRHLVAVAGPWPGRETEQSSSWQRYGPG